MPLHSPIRAWIDDLAAALRLLTRIPLPRGLPADADWARATRAYPLAGLAVGLGGGLVFLLAASLGLPVPIAALLALAATIALSGALHEDGLADVADGFGGGRDRERKLAIMRDSRIGTYGVLALVLSVGLRATALVALGAGPAVLAALLTAHALARGVLPTVMFLLPLARQDGLAAATGKPRGRDVLSALAIAVAVAAIALGPSAGLALLAIALVLTGALAWLARRQVGGYTGDVLGAVAQSVETAVLLTLVTMT